MTKAVNLSDYVGIVLMGFIIGVPILTLLFGKFIDLTVAITSNTSLPISGQLVGGAIVAIGIFTIIVSASTRITNIDPLRFKFR